MLAAVKVSLEVDEGGCIGQLQRDSRLTDETESRAPHRTPNPLRDSAWPLSPEPRVAKSDLYTSTCIRGGKGIATNTIWIYSVVAEVRICLTGT